MQEDFRINVLVIPVKYNQKKFPSNVKCLIVSGKNEKYTVNQTRTKQPSLSQSKGRKQTID